MRADARKLDCVDGLRGIAVLAVVLFHHRLAIETAPEHGAFYRLLAPTRLGVTGVHLFLVLSGFCLAHSLLSRGRAGNCPSLRSYLAARWWRIAPPYYAAIALYLVITEVYRHLGHAIPPLREPSLRQLAFHLPFLHGLRADTLDAINAPFWSLSLEFQFYLTLPLLFVLAERLGYATMLAAVAAISLAWGAFVSHSLVGTLFLANGFFLGRWSEFALGICVAALYNRGALARINRTAGLAMGAACLLLLSAAFATALAVPSYLNDFLLGAGYASLLAVVLISGARGGPIGRLFASRPLVLVGSISYSLYLTHSAAIELVVPNVERYLGARGSLAETVTLAASLLTTLAVGSLFYRLVERRFVRSVDRASRRPAPHQRRADGPHPSPVRPRLADPPVPCERAFAPARR